MLDIKDFVINTNLTREQLRYHPDVDDQSYVIDATLMTQAAIKATGDFAVQMAQFLFWSKAGMMVLWDHILEKNKGGAIGECLASAYCRLIGGKVVKNPHESGSPDFFPLVESTKSLLESPTEKSYKGGGFDAKSCKIPGLGFMEVEASSHHRQTSTVLVTGWNYVDGVPHILAGFFTNELEISDWKIGSIPKNDESKPTSSARLLPSGKEKLRRNWLFLHKSMRLPREKKNVVEYGLVPLLALKQQESEEPI